MQEYLSPEEARSQGFIPIDEAVKLKPVNRSTFARQAQNGAIPSVQVLKGSRPVYWILASAINKNVALTSSKGYEQLKDKWLKGMEVGSCSWRNTPTSSKYRKGTLEWGLSTFWDVLELSPTITEINAENLAKVMTCERFQVDRIKRRDFYSTKMHIYRACTRFTDFLIKEGLKTKSDLDALRECLPGRVFKPKRGFVDEIEVQEAIKFNRSWFDGRSQYDIEVTDMLLHLYAYAGLRRTEPAWLSKDCIDFKTNLMLVFGKGSKERYVPIVLFPELRPKLDQWISYIRPKSGEDCLLVQKDGTPLTEGSIKDRLQNLGMAMRVAKAHKQLALENIDWSKEKLKSEAKRLAKTLPNPVKAHDYRRGFATNLAKRGMPMSMIQEILGHVVLETTQGYVQINIQQIMEWTTTNFNSAPTVSLPSTISHREALFNSINKKTI